MKIHDEVNFELRPDYARCFDDLDPKAILQQLSLLRNQRIEPGKTLLFLDEIQECPHAILALRYFKEKMPELHVIAAGSLLEFTLNHEELRMPVGRVETFFLRPLSFKEFLIASSEDQMVDFLSTISMSSQISEAVHNRLLKRVREYLILGGMPSVVQDYIVTGDLLNAHRKQAILMNTYRNDFGKYAKNIQHKYLQRLFEKVPGMVAENFKYVNVDPEMQSRELKKALDALEDANLVNRVYTTRASGLPLNASMNEKKFKLIFLDVGLVSFATNLDPIDLLNQDFFLLNRGAIAEQFVAQELLAYCPPYLPGELFFWCRDKVGSKSEVDYLYQVGKYILPIEVKAGKTGRLKSLHHFRDSHNLPFGIRISQHPLSYHNEILSVPLYMIFELKRIVKEVLEMSN